VSLNPVAERITVTGEQAEELNAMQRRPAAESLYRKPIADDGPAPGLKTARKPFCGTASTSPTFPREVACAHT